MAEKMNTGVVVSFYGRKGYGFIKPEGSEEDLFVHQSEIQTDGYRTLREGQTVKFLVAEKDGRIKAVMVTPVDKLNVKKNRRRNGNGNRNRNGYVNGGGVEGRECYTCGGVGHLARDCSSAATVTKGGSGGASDGSGDRTVCFRCGTVGHFARECTWEVVERKCYNCGVAGHMARDCTLDNGGNNRGRESTNGGRGGGECYTCGVVGHLARDCTSKSGGGRGGGECYTCGVVGHLARDCTSKSGGGKR